MKTHDSSFGVVAVDGAHVFVQTSTSIKILFNKAKSLVFGLKTVFASP
jgi:hypothetical protein